MDYGLILTYLVLAPIVFGFIFRKQLRAWWIRQKLQKAGIASGTVEPPALSVPLGDVPAAKERRLAIEAIDQAPRPNTVVRRYREAPPLVRDAAGQWRSGRLDLVLGGEFDLLQAGQR